MRTIADINLESALYDLRPACRIMVDLLDVIHPRCRAADREALRWIANTVEALARDAERNGASAGIAEAARLLADAAERLGTPADIRKAHDACEAVGAEVEAALIRYGLPEPLTAPRHAGITVPPAG